ncbi:MAG TPA: hypothetical protein VEC38_13170 [Candidatus Binataceae bacterium]|nr:hypothetical protein [Candidatus Binataceae bacterium]
MIDDDGRLIQDTYVAQVLTLARSIKTEDHFQTNTCSSDDDIDRALKVISKERSRILTETS